MRFVDVFNLCWEYLRVVGRLNKRLDVFNSGGRKKDGVDVFWVRTPMCRKTESDCCRIFVVVHV
jgi:hypothetical protein